MLGDVLIAAIMDLVIPPATDLLRRTRTRAGTHGEQPMFPTIIAVRNERVVAAVVTPRMAATLSCAQTLAVGLDADALVVVAQVQLQGRPALTYSVMTRERQAKFFIQPVALRDDELVSDRPLDAGEPQDATLLRALAEAMGQRPVDVTRVARTDRGGTFGEQTFLPAEQGRVVVDAGTMTTLHESVRGIAGQALYLPRSPEAGRLALGAGLPRQALVTGADWTAAVDTTGKDV
ncbi:MULTISPECIES: hypothetical protein [unclassified Ornithinimicrobium]|uniref:hypothetical protein n=1 Tax=unclassified Ornithinimicrobium TaxID=2615080 RepID=UPI0038538E5F